MKRFKAISSEIFKYLVTDLNYKLSEQKEKSLLFDNSKLKVFIYLEYSNVFVIIKQDSEDFDFGILYLLYFRQKIKTFNEILNTDSKIILQLANYATHMLTFLKDADFDNFEWKSLYKKFYSDLRYLQSKMGTKFSFSHPIYLKFINGDESWKEDLTKFILQ